MSIQQIWNEKFSREGYLYGKEPNAFLKEQLKNIKAGSSILFLGEGEGRMPVMLPPEALIPQHWMPLRLVLQNVKRWLKP